MRSAILSFMLTSVAAAGMAIALSACSVADTERPAAPVPAAAAIHLQQPAARILAGTDVTLALKQPLRSGRARKGDPLDLAVAVDVRGMDGSILIPAGTPATGTILESSRARAYGREGTVAIACQYIQLPSGTRVPIRAAGRGAQYVARGRNRFGESILTAAVACVLAVAAVGDLRMVGGMSADSKDPVPLVAIVVAATGPSALWRGSEATVPEGRQIKAVVASDTTVVLLPLPPTQSPSGAAPAPI